MASSKKAWFITPSWSLSEKAVKLGQIIADPASPDNALNKGDIDDPLDVHTHIQSNYSFHQQNQRVVSAGIFAKFLKAVGIAASMDDGTSGKDWFITADVLETREFYPDEESISKRVTSRDVQRFLSASRFRKPLYIITGLKIARGTRLRDYSSRNVSVSDEVALGMAAGAPISTVFSATRTYEHSFASPSDFVFAYRLRRISVTKNRASLKKSRTTSGLEVGMPLGAETGDNIRRPFSRVDSEVGSGMDISLDESNGAEEIRNVVVEDLDDEEGIPSVAVYSTDYDRGATI